MSDDKKTVKWYGQGIYSKPRTDKDGTAYEQFFVRVWVSSQKRVRVFKAGRTQASAESLRRKVQGDPDAAVAKRDKAVQQAREGLTVAGLYKAFTAGYRGRGGTDFYVNVLRPMSEAMGSTRVCDVTAATFDSYFRKRRAERTSTGAPKVGESTIRKECICAGKMFKWGRQRGLCTVNPLIDYDKPKQPAGPPARALSYEEEDKMLAVLPQLERDFVAWALDSGMRRREIIALSWQGIDRPSGVIHVLGTKTGKLRAVPLALSDRLSDILARRPRRIGCDLVFHTQEGAPLDVDRLNGLLEGAMKAAGVPKTRGALWNVLRKTWVSRLYASGKVLPQQEADWGGHSMAVATRHYRELSPAGRDGAAGLLNRATVASTVAGGRQSA